MFGEEANALRDILKEALNEDPATGPESFRCDLY